MNRLEMQHEAAMPRTTRYTLWRRAEDGSFEYAGAWCTLVWVVRAAQRMTPKGYITENGRRP